MISLVKKGILYLVIILGIIFGYFYLTGKSLSSLPSEVSGFFNQEGSSKNTNPVYYKDPSEKMPKDQ